ncbi:MAG: repressor LexA [Rubrobacter sp.]|jgi:repressor LexA|nr:repressor LexA [Rubrobacter sp.]MDQ3360098.1 transcriptional repressor LexA [Actinomycetota bacterium]
MADSPEATRRDILGFLVHKRLRGDVSPTVREIGAAVGLRSSRSVHRHLERLRADGLVASVEGRPRTLTVTDRGLQAVGEMPLMGRIAAGRGLEAVSADDEAYSLYSTLLLSDRGGGRYVLRVVGDSMYGAHIADGDVLVVEENEDPPDGAVVVALLHDGDEVTVKKLHREGDTVRLVPKNGDHEDIVVPADGVTIQGEVVYVIHPPRR